MSYENDIINLRKSNLLSTNDEYDKFEEALINLSSCNDFHIIKDLCIAFNDKTCDEEVMFGLIHLIEKFEGEDALLEVINSIPNMELTAKKWSKILIYRILNDDVSRFTLRKILKSRKIIKKNFLIELLLEIKKEDAKYFEKSIKEVLDF